MIDSRRFSRRSECPLCGGGVLRDRFVVSEFQISDCKACSFVFVREHLTREDLAPYYAETGEDYVYTDDSNAENLSYYYRRLIRLLEQTGGPGRLLDVGCSSGQFLDVLASPWEGFGVELSPQYARIAQKKHGSRIRQGTLADSAALSERFDVITFMDVLDHSADPLDDLRIANRLLAPGGRVAVKVHNIGCLYARVSGSKFYAIIPPFHLSYFSRKTIALAFARTGFEVAEVRFIGHRLALKTIPYRLARNRTSGFFFALHRVLAGTRMGNWPVHKNLRDIITVVGVKRREV